MSYYRPNHISVSAIQLYVKCPAQFRQRYVDRLVSPNNPPQAFGKAFHSALEAEHKGENSERALVAAWNIRESELAAGGQMMHPDKVHALALLDEYKRRGLGGLMGAPELKFRLPFPSAKIPVPVTGYIDLPIPERRRFREFKTTSGSSWTYEKIASEHQLHVYGWAQQRTYHQRVQVAEYVIFGTKEPTVEVIEAVPSPDGFRLFEIVAEKVWTAVNAGKFDGCGECKELCKPPVERATTGPSFVWE